VPQLAGILTDPNPHQDVADEPATAGRRDRIGVTEQQHNLMPHQPLDGLGVEQPARTFPVRAAVEPVPIGQGDRVHPMSTQLTPQQTTQQERIASIGHVAHCLGGATTGISRVVSSTESATVVVLARQTARAWL
jgi:hypothetical protein